MQDIILKIKTMLAKAADFLKSGGLKRFCKKTFETIARKFKDRSLVSLVVSSWHLLLAGLFVFLILYYPIGAFMTHDIDKNFDFNAAANQKNQTQILETQAALIDREVNKHSFTPNLPFFYPSAVLDNMPAYQTGVIDGLRVIAKAFADAMPDSRYLQKAAEALQADPTVWYFSDKPIANRQYLAARHYLEKAVEEINSGAGIPSTVPAAILEAQIAGLENAMEDIKKTLPVYNDSPANAEADEVFYRIQGESYVFYLTLRDLPVDFPEFAVNEAAMRFYKESLKTLKAALTFDPLIIRNAAPDSFFAPNHLSSLGFYLSEAQNDLQAVLRTLNK